MTKRRLRSDGVVVQIGSKPPFYDFRSSRDSGSDPVFYPVMGNPARVAQGDGMAVGRPKDGNVGRLGGYWSFTPRQHR